MVDSTNGKSLGIAILGLGIYSKYNVGPALQQTRRCHLSGVITGTPEKAREWRHEYELPSGSVYSYDDLEAIANNPDIHAVYIATPNSTHREYVERVAATGKHVICDKPMATSVEDCRAMIRACDAADVSLSISYRMQADPFAREMMRLGQRRVYGELTRLDSGFGIMLEKLDDYRMSEELAGGGALMDVGIYPLQGVLYTIGRLPVSVTARYRNVRTDVFAELEDGIEWEFIFPNGLVSHMRCSYSKVFDYVEAEADRGSFSVSPAYQNRDVRGRTSDGEMDLPPIFQQAALLEEIALSIAEHRRSPVPGELGLRDQYLLEKIYEAADSGESIDLTDIPLYYDRLELHTELDPVFWGVK